MTTEPRKSGLRLLSIAFLASLSSCLGDEFPNIDAGMVEEKTILAADLRERAPGRFLIIAHRGYSRGYRENSLPAFEAAIAADADLIEADLRESADGAVVLSHDYVGGKTFKELESQGIVSLSSLLQLAKNRALLLLDLKDRYFCASQCANFQTMTWSMRRKMRAVKSVNL